MLAFDMRAVVYFDDHPSPNAGPDEIAGAIGDQLMDCFKTDTQSNLVSPGQLSLCGIPELILCPAELATASDPNEVALLKIYDRSPGPKPKWETFKSRVKLVKSGLDRRCVIWKKGESEFIYPERRWRLLISQVEYAES